ncbi:hypothetical protein HPC49_21745 [Pyxidicoccus fallax]|uniref:Lipoprotein n=1 Tax=Pyxidicoccus fallax TaxID=394095 RepID=A0A848LRD9_9BACT|nr:hypothetical protein [Pyxidicoccus fallax]NMO20123.1 hypothetical protein [Pyxidicoccus fallax]NPC80836.1 hypothetical protein [Pyxidicoccus fallax]
MKKLSFVVAAGLALGMLTGCGAEDAQPEVEAKQGPRYSATRADGSEVIIRDATHEAGAPATMEVEGDRTVNANGCWVTLQWCSEPGTGDAVCTQNGQCTTTQFINACLSLYNDICV